MYSSKNSEALVYELRSISAVLILLFAGAVVSDQRATAPNCSLTQASFEASLQAYMSVSQSTAIPSLSRNQPPELSWPMCSIVRPSLLQVVKQ